MGILGGEIRRIFAGGTTIKKGAIKILNARLVSAFALVFRYAPLLTSSVNGGGIVTPSPRAGRVGVGA